jgi:tripartite-type tricarboxylate transporter receptor subunit TctC
MRARIIARAFAFACGIAASPYALAQKAPTVTIIVGFSPGGVYDLTARLWSRHLGRFLPGEPNIVVQNMPGAGSLGATNYLSNVAPHDGTTLAVINGANVLESLFDNPAAKFDPRQFSWIGGRSQETGLCAVWHTAKAKSFADLQTIETTVGSSGAGSRTTNHPLIFNALLGTKLRIVTGYPGGEEVTLAMQRGEIDGECGWAWGAIKSRGKQWVADGELRLLLQAGLKKVPELPDVPSAMDLAHSQDDRDIMQALFTDNLLSWPLVAPPSLTPEKVAELRTAFNAMMNDSELRKDAEQAQLDIDLVRGEDMQETVKRLFALPAALRERAKAILKQAP